MKLTAASDWIAALLLGWSGFGAVAVWQSAQVADRSRSTHGALRAATAAGIDLERTAAVMTEAARAHAATGDAGHRSAFDAELRRGIAERSLAVLASTPGLVGAAPAGQAIGAARGHAETLRTLHGEAAALVARGDRGAAQALLHAGPYEAARDGLRQQSRRLQELVRQQAAATAAGFARQALWAQRFAALALLGNAVTVGLALFGFYRRRMIVPLTELAARLERRAAGDPEVRFDGIGRGNEIGRIAAVLQRMRDTEVELEAHRRSVASAEGWYRHIIESAPDGMLVVDAQGTIVLANAEIHRILGYGPQQLQGVNVDTLVPSEVRGRHSAYRERFMRASEGKLEHLQGRFAAQHRSGATFAVELSLSKMPEMDAFGPCVCVALRRVGAAQDPPQALDRAGPGA